MITLYHGSNIGIEHIDLQRCNPDKDFGRGFYLTASFMFHNSKLQTKP